MSLHSGSGEAILGRFAYLCLGPSISALDMKRPSRIRFATTTRHIFAEKMPGIFPAKKYRVDFYESRNSGLIILSTRRQVSSVIRPSLS
jgi:hypothetical protein